jgi:hypothetical protein
VKLGKEVTILTDEPSKRMMELATERSGLQGALEPLRIFPLSLPEAEWPAYFEEASGSFDHLVSIERCVRIALRVVSCACRVRVVCVSCRVVRVLNPNV